MSNLFAELTRRLIVRPYSGKDGKVLVLVIFAFAGLLARADVDLPKLASQVRPSVGLVEVFDASKTEVATGSGFFINGNEFVTNCHVVDGARSVKIKMEGGQEWDSIGTVAADAKKDIAILFINCKPQPVLTLSKAATVAAGTHIAVIGSPLGLEGTLSDGIVSGQRLTSNGPLLQITAPISHGSSGSPVLNDKGEVVGVAAMNLEGGQALNFAIAASTVQGMLDQITDKTPFAAYPDSSADQAVQLLRDPDYQSAMSLMAQNNYEDALQLLKGLLEKYPKAAEVYYQIGYIFDRNKMWAEAVQAYQQAAELNPNGADIWCDMGKTLTRAGKPKDAIGPLQRAATLAPNDSHVWDALGCAYGNAGDHKDEAAAFFKAIMIEPSDRLYGLLATAYTSLGQQQETSGEHTAALDSYKLSNSIWETARKRYPDWPEPTLETVRNYTEMALTLEKLNNTAAANGLVETALNAAPTDVMVLWNASTYYYRGGDAARYRDAIGRLNVINPSMAAQLQNFLQTH